MLDKIINLKELVPLTQNQVLVKFCQLHSCLKEPPNLSHASLGQKSDPDTHTTRLLQTLAACFTTEHIATHIIWT